MSNRSRLLVLALAIGTFVCCSVIEWHPNPLIRRAAGIVLGTLILWIAEVAPLGVVALAIPVAAVFSGVLTWDRAIAPWGDKVLFLFLGAFLLARALDKHGAFDWIGGQKLYEGPSGRPSAGRLAIIVLVVSGAVSLFQNNTAVTAMLLPAVTLLARRLPAPSLPLLALAYGATLGGMGTPVGTAPNFIGYARIRELDPGFGFLTWLRVGLPVWIGTTLIAWGVLAAAAVVLRRREAKRNATQTEPAPAAPPASIPPWSPIAELADSGPARGAVAPALTPRERTVGCRWAVVAFSLTAAIWLGGGVVRSVVPLESPTAKWVERFLPDELIPVAAAWLLFLVRVGPRRRPVLDRHDFQTLDWDTLFLIAGGLCLGKVLETSGASIALANGVRELQLPPLLVLFALAGSTVLLSELTSNTATASLLVPIAASVAPAAGVSPVQAIWLVALSASLGFALPVSTPPNALVYGTRLIPLRVMAAIGLLLDLACVTWVVLCIRWFGAV